VYREAYALVAVVAPGEPSVMTIGAALFCIATGAILYFAVTAEVAGLDIQTVGLILLVIGALGLVLGLVLMSRRPAEPRSGPYG
jgi:uncharacterized protein DUF6458